MALVDYYLKIDGVDGESDKKGVEKQIEVLSWSWGEAHTGTRSHGSGGGSGRVSMQDFHFTMTVNKATPKLMLKCATGEHIHKAVLTCRKGHQAQAPYFTITFHDIVLSGYQIGGSQGADHLPTDQVSFNYAKIEWEYKVQAKDGSLGDPQKAGYDLTKLDKV